MRVYIPFDDGSSISFDGERFTLHRRPVEIGADPAVLDEGKAAEAWERNLGALTRALESAWLLQRERGRQDRTKRVYSRDACPPLFRESSALSETVGHESGAFRSDDAELPAEGTESGIEGAKSRIKRTRSDREMSGNGNTWQMMLKRRPLNVKGLWGNENVGLVSGRDIFAACRELGCVALAANCRHPLTAKGVLRAAKKLGAAVVLEIAKSENSYCYGNFENLPHCAVKYSGEMGDGVVFAMHVDHYGIKGEGDVNKAVGQIPHLVANGWTSFAVDASHLEDYDNLMATRDVAMSIPAYLGLEVEVGEIKGPGELTTVEEALYFVGGLNAWGIYPDLLAISNGSLHGTYDASSGQHEGIDLHRTLEIAEAIRPYGVSIAQHGISGTPVGKVGEFHKFGINKGNVATLFQNVLFGLKMDPDTGNADTASGAYVKEADRGISEGLWNRMVAWADGEKIGRKSGDYKKANLPFGEAILGEPEAIQNRIVDETEAWAVRLIRAMHAEGSAEKVLEIVARRADHNGAPERSPLHPRSEYGPDRAPNRSKAQGDFDE